MKLISRNLSLLAVLGFFLVSCGYHNPYVYTGPEKVIYIKDWKNRTSELGLDSDIYHSLVKWYQKSRSIKITKDKSSADLILAGEIISISLPSLSYGSNNTTKEVKIRLKVRYILKDLTSDKVLFEVAKEEYTEGYVVDDTTAQTRDNQEEAIETIVTDLSQRIYQKTLVELPKL
ncbi:LptE family protein [Desulfosediminicola flagellatus]|uniref:LPS assembly lipoprotein LptE n=1 Tax=Desulfosediminicola flagellatus TaxID=2569541 RepID=UPI00142ECFDE|nr:LptE family protein [Desulfosediminicola flagellatus]